MTIRTFFYVLSVAVCSLAAESLSARSGEGLIAHWQFDESSGSRLLDSSGNELHGVVKDPSVGRIGGARGGALRFTGGSRQAAVPHHELLNFGNGDFTIAFWVRFDGVQSEYRDTPLSKHGIDEQCRNPWTSTGWTIFMEAYAKGLDENGRKIRTLERAGPFLRLTDGVHVEAEDYPGRCSQYQDDIADGQWHHVTFVRAADGLQYYRDGVRVEGRCEIRQPGASLDNPDSPLTFGCGYAGDLDEVLIYRRALQPDEIRSLATSGS